MADARLRDLTRWEHFDLETQVRLLRERMRIGEVHEDRVAIAAALGDPAAALVTSYTLGTPEDFADWVLYTDWEVMSRAAIAVGRHVQDQCGAQVALADRALASAELHLIRPSLPHLLACGEWWWTFRNPDTAAGWIVAQVNCVVGYEPEGEPEPKRLGSPLELDERGRCFLPFLLEDAKEFPGAFEAAHSELLEWALGLRDPLLERVEQRTTV